jgi:hypothetical protein
MMARYDVHDGTVKFMWRHVVSGYVNFELCWRERKLLAGSPKSDRSQTKCSPLVLQDGGWALC